MKIYAYPMMKIEKIEAASSKRLSLGLFLALAVGVTGLLTSGCTTTTVVDESKAPPRYADRVQVVSYDSTPRPFNYSPGVYYYFQQIMGRPRHPIAQLSMVGWPNDDVQIREALIWKAKSLGADGIYIMPPAYAGWISVPFGPTGTKYNYVAEAFVWPQNIRPGAPANVSTTQPPAIPEQRAPAASTNDSPNTYSQ